MTPRFSRRERRLGRRATVRRAVGCSVELGRADAARNRTRFTLLNGLFQWRFARSRVCVLNHADGRYTALLDHASILKSTA